MEWRTLDTLPTTVIFALIVLVVFSFTFGIGSTREIGLDRIVPGVIWTVLAFASVVAMIRSIQSERYNETLAGLCLTPIDRGALFTGKMVANMIQLTLLQWILVPLTAVFFNYDPTPFAAPLALVLLLHGLGLAILGTLFAGVTARLGRGEALLTILLFPAATPLLISAVKCTAACLAGRSLSTVSEWLLVTAGFDVLYFFVALLTFEFVLEE